MVSLLNLVFNDLLSSLYSVWGAHQMYPCLVSLHLHLTPSVPPNIPYSVSITSYDPTQSPGRHRNCSYLCAPLSQSLLYQDLCFLSRVW